MDIIQENAIKRIVEFYTNKWTIIAIYLTGSRANGSSRHNSDYDLHIVYKDEIPLSMVLDDIITDVKVINSKSLDTSIIETPYAPAAPFLRIFLNEEYLNQIENLESRTREIHDVGPIKWDDKILNEKQQQMFRFLDAIKNTTDNEVVCFRHMCKFFDLALNYWFLIRKEWSKSTHQAVKVFQEKDPAFYEVIIKFIQANDISGKSVICGDIYNALFRQ